MSVIPSTRSGASARTAPPSRGVGEELPPWSVLGPPAMVEVREPTVAALSGLPSGTTVALVSERPLSRSRLRRLAAQADVVVERELIVVRVGGRAVVVLDDQEVAVRHFWDAVITVPPGVTVAALPLGAAIRLARSLPWEWTGLVVPGRVLLGRRR